MNFKDAQTIQSVVNDLRLALQPVMQNRTKINDQFNGLPPWSEAERQANKIFTNANWLEGTRIAHNARNQLNNSTINASTLFNVILDKGPVAKRADWGARITKEINRELKRSKQFRAYWEATNTQVVLHGPGPGYWADPFDPVPIELGVEDVLVASGTLRSLRNMGFFAIYREWTHAELWQMVHGSEEKDPGWNVEAVDKILESLKESPLQPIYSGNRWLMPEKLAADYKENAGWFLSSSAPKVFCWDFFFESEGEKGSKTGWQRRIVIDVFQAQQAAQTEGMGMDAMNTFLYDSSKRKQSSYAESHSELIHWQFGDCSNVAPFRYYSVRSMGFLLYAACLWQDRLRCRLNDAVYENLMMYFRNVGEDDRERLEKIDLWHVGIIPDGVSMVPANERHTVNENLALMQLSQNRQLMSESSASYLPDVERGGRKTPETATAEMIRLNTSVELTSAMLNNSYETSEWLYREIFRRFSLKESRHPMVQRVRARLIAQGVPLEMLDIEGVDIQPERVLGGGNKAMEMAQADRFMAARPSFDPPSQRTILKMWARANSNPDTADMLVPEQQPAVTSSTERAQLACGVLMDNLPYTVAPDTNLLEYIPAMLQMAMQLVQQLPAVAQLPDGDNELGTKLAGLQSIILHVVPLIQQLAQDPQQIEAAKMLEEGVAQLQAQAQPFVKELEKRAKEKEAQAGGMTPEQQADMQAKLIDAEFKGRIAEENAAMKRQHQSAKFAAGLEQNNAKTLASIKQDAVKTKAQIDLEREKAEAQMEIEREKAEQDKQIAKEQADAQIAIEKKKAAEAPKPKPSAGGK